MDIKLEVASEMLNEKNKEIAELKKTIDGMEKRIAELSRNERSYFGGTAVLRFT